MRGRFIAAAIVGAGALVGCAAEPARTAPQPEPRPAAVADRPAEALPKARTVEVSLEAQPAVPAAPPRAYLLSEFFPSGRASWAYAAQGARKERACRCLFARPRSQAEIWSAGPAEGGRVVAHERSHGARCDYLLESKGSLAILAQTRGGRATEVFTPALVLFPERIASGGTFTTESTAWSCRPGGLPLPVNVKRTVRLAAVEDVTVPAGTFAGCLRLETETARTRAGHEAQVARETVWLAPGVGIVKRERTGGAGAKPTVLELTKAGGAARERAPSIARRAAF
jgi:hypothetical protein